MALGGLEQCKVQIQRPIARQGDQAWAEGYSLLVCEGPLTTKVLAAMDACTAQ